MQASESDVMWISKVIHSRIHFSKMTGNLKERVQSKIDSTSRLKNWWTFFSLKCTHISLSIFCHTSSNLIKRSEWWKWSAITTRIEPLLCARRLFFKRNGLLIFVQSNFERQLSEWKMYEHPFFPCHHNHNLVMRMCVCVVMLWPWAFWVHFKSIFLGHFHHKLLMCVIWQ